MATLMQNIEQSIQDFNNIKQALIDKNIEVPDGTKTSEYGNLIKNITDSELTLKFQQKNILMDVTSTSTFFTIVKEDEKVIVTVPETSESTWYQMFDSIPFKLNTFYKLTVTNFGYGRIGLSNKSNNPHNGTGGSVVTTNTNACVFSSAEAKENEVDGDNYMIANTNNIAYFIVNLETGSDSSTTQNGAFWFCSDLLYNGERKGYSFEITLQEQEI